MAAKAAATVQAEFTTLTTAVTALETSLQAEIDAYGQDDGDDTLARDTQSCYLACVDTLAKMGLQLAGLRSQVGSRYKTL